VKPLPRHAAPAAESIAAVRRLLGQLDVMGETFGTVALDDESLAPIATALTAAADLAGQWLKDHSALPMGHLGGRAEAVVPTTAVRPAAVARTVPITSVHAPAPADWGDLFARPP
jgi:hypothetical protein